MKNRSTLGFAMLLVLLTLPMRGEDPPSANRTLRDWIRGAGGGYDTIRMFADQPDPVFRAKEGFTDDPSAIGYDIQRKWDALPRKGQSDPIPFPGHWWPMKQDGIAGA